MCKKIVKAIVLAAMFIFPPVAVHAGAKGPAVQSSFNKGMFKINVTAEGSVDFDAQGRLGFKAVAEFVNGRWRFTGNGNAPFGSPTESLDFEVTADGANLTVFGNHSGIRGEGQWNPEFKRSEWEKD